MAFHFSGGRLWKWREEQGKVFDGLAERAHQRAEEQSNEERHNIKTYHDDGDGLCGKSRLLTGDDGKVGGEDEENHHQ